MGECPYLGIRYGRRGEAFARTDSGYLTTLVDGRLGYVLEQTQWLARVLSNRGMPRWLMEVHLDILAEELSTAVPQREPSYAMLRRASEALREERHGILGQSDFASLDGDFAQDGGDLVKNFGGLVISAVCDEVCGIEFAVSSLLAWVQNYPQGSPQWRSAVSRLLHAARQSACAHRP